MMRKALKWCGIATFVLALPVIALYAIGASLDREHRASVSRSFEVPPARIYAAITDVEAFPRWREGVERVEVLSREPLRWRETTSDGPMTYEVIERVADRRFVTRIADEDLPFGGTWTYAIEPHGQGATLRITEDGFIDPPPFRVLMKWVFGHDATMREYLDQLGARLR
jgi:uncharacterized protein YndB with AHSA1/START domain